MSAFVANTGFSVSALLRAVWPESTAKNAARAANTSPRTVEGWIAERCCPSAARLVAMAEADDRLRFELISILLKKGPIPNAPTLEEGPVLVDRRRSPVCRCADGTLLGSDASQG